MLLASIFVLFGAFMWVTAGVLVYFRRRQLRKTELMRGVETTEAVEWTTSLPARRPRSRAPCAARSP